MAEGINCSSKRVMPLSCREWNAISLYGLFDQSENGINARKNGTVLRNGSVFFKRVKNQEQAGDQRERKRFLLLLDYTRINRRSLIFTPLELRECQNHPA